MIVRADNGGLGNQTWEAWRHLQPEATMVVDLAGHGRSDADVDRYDHGRRILTSGPPNRRQAQELCDGIDTVFTCETFYREDFPDLAVARGTNVVAQVNPELYWPQDFAGARVWLPTTWERHRVPHERIMPVPVALDRFDQVPRTAARVFYHPAAPAMRDRNGTEIVRDAIPYIRAPVVLVIRGVEVRGTPQLRAVSKYVQLLELPYIDDGYWQAYPNAADVLLLPRRYGGLCLPMQEAAARGMPVITTALPPQIDYPHAWFIPAERAEQVPMRGGTFDVWRADPKLLGDTITELAQQPDIVADLSVKAIEWARSLSWSQWVDEYRDALT